MFDLCSIYVRFMFDLCSIYGTHNLLQEMETILITSNSKYKSLIHATKVIDSPSVDIVAIIDTEVFLNHHHDLTLYFLKDNFPFQLHLPLKISKHLLDRNEGPVELTVNKIGPITISTQNDLVQILSKLQQSQKQPQCSIENVFRFELWNIKIKLIIFHQPHPNEQKFKELINKESTPNTTPSKLSKLVLFINQQNYEQFLSWEGNKSNLLNSQENSKLSKEYQRLRHSVEDEKNGFRNKIKTVEAILGENINIEKLINDDKQDNSEYKRLKETFETIKNIDNIIIQQERKIDKYKEELKEARKLKHSELYKKAKLSAVKQKQMWAIHKSIEVLKFNIECVEKKCEEFRCKKSFNIDQKCRVLLDREVQYFKKSSLHSNNSSLHSSNSKMMIANHKLYKNSLPNSPQKTMKQQYLSALMKREQCCKKQKQLCNQSRAISQSDEIEANQNLLRSVWEYYQSNQKLLKKMAAFAPAVLNQSTNYEFIVLSQLKGIGRGYRKSVDTATLESFSSNSSIRQSLHLQGAHKSSLLLKSNEKIVHKLKKMQKKF